MIRIGQPAREDWVTARPGAAIQMTTGKNTLKLTCLGSDMYHLLICKDIVAQGFAHSVEDTM